MNKSLILLRIRSWMITSTFIMIAACCGFNYASTEAGVIGLCVAFSFFMIFLCYQTPDDVGKTYNAYLSIGIASLFFIQVIYFIPLIWILSVYMLQSLNWRTWLTSILGAITPYWLALPFYLYRQDYDGIIRHFEPLRQLPETNIALSPIQTIVFVLIAALAIAGAINFWRRSYEERIRTRQIYAFLQWIGLAVGIFILLQPQHYDILIRVMIICACPFIAHFFTFTKTKVTNYLFIGIVILVILLSIVNTNASLLEISNQTIVNYGWGY